MTDYNDGEWHGWNGGECPVHPLSVIELRTTEGLPLENRKAGITAWGYPPFLFRVTKEHKEPREFWFSDFDMELLDKKPSGWVGNLIHVREVTE